MNKKKKKILFVNNNLAVGGVQKALINLLHRIKHDYDIDLFLFNNDGEYKDEIDEEVQVIEAVSPLKVLGMSQAKVKELGLFYYMLRFIAATYARVISNHFPIHVLTSMERKLKGYDAAISFLHCGEERQFYGGCNEFVLYRVNAPTKICFLHCDFLNYGGNTKKNREHYKLFDKAVTVSEGCRQNLIMAVPELESKTFCVNNCINYSEITKLADENPIVYENDYTHLVTVARLSEEKGIQRGIRVLQRLKESGYKVKWHIIGDGVLKSAILSDIKKINSSEYIHLYGSQSNPYRYLKNADLFLLPSFHEAAPMVINEAKCLKVPVLTTDTVSAEEMIIKNKEGFICENSEKGIYNALSSILDNPCRLTECREYLSLRDYNDNNAVMQFRKLMGEVHCGNEKEYR